MTEFRVRVHLTPADKTTETDLDRIVSEVMDRIEALELDGRIKAAIRELKIDGLTVSID